MMENGQGLYSLMNTYGPLAADMVVPGSGQLIQAQGKLISLLPEGDLRNFAQQIRFGPIGYFIQKITGVPWTTGQAKLAERFNDQIAGNGDIGYRDAIINEDFIKQSQLAFTILFGVRITTGEDLDALDSGSAAYYARPDKQDIPKEAVQRAVYLKQNYYPISSYNTGQWDLSYFARNPLVAPIPDPFRVGAKYNGPLPGGGTAKNGILDLSAADKPVLTQSGTTEKASLTSNVFGIILMIGLLVTLIYSFIKKPKNANT